MSRSGGDCAHAFVLGESAVAISVRAAVAARKIRLVTRWGWLRNLNTARIELHCQIEIQLTISTSRL